MVGTQTFRAVTAGLAALFLLLSPPVPTLGQTLLVPEGAVWKYLDDGSDQGTAWQNVLFDDNGWDSGPAQLGYGDGDEATVVGYGPDPNNKYITTYFRHSFEVGDPSLVSYLQVRLLRDDGAVVYLNGFEITRSNITDGPISYLTLAESTVGGAAEDAFFTSLVDATELNAGTNVLAVEIHQRSVTSSDISFDLEVTGLGEIAHPVRKAPYLVYNGDNTEIQVLWQLMVTDTCLIEWGLDQQYGLGSLETIEYGDDHQHGVIIEGLEPSTLYHYRVSAREDTYTGSFRAAPPVETGEVKFLVYGDTRTYPADHDQVAAEMMATISAAPELQSMLVSVGDLVSNGDQEGDWDTEFFDPSYVNIQTMLASLPYQSCRGNHEESGAVFSKYFPYSFVTPHYWSFDYGPAHFVVIDQYQSYAPGSVQHSWIETDLASTNKPWKFLVFHEPGWSAGGHSNNAGVQNILQPLCLEYGVAIAFAGHNHYYARAVVDGVQHVTTGGGGAPQYAPNPGYPNIVTVSQTYHFCAVEIDGTELTFTAISAAGDTIDQFTMTQPLSSVEQPNLRVVTLRDAFPNPFNPNTTIAFEISERQTVTLRVYDLAGRLVKELIGAEEPSPGRHEVVWDGRDEEGRQVASGTYFYRLKAGEYSKTKRMALIK